MLFLACIHCLFVGTWPLPGYDTFSQVGQHENALSILKLLIFVE